MHITSYTLAERSLIVFYFLKVYDNDVLIDVFCEKELPDLITSSSRHVRVDFRTDEDRVGKGFSIFHAAIGMLFNICFMLMLHVYAS